MTGEDIYNAKASTLDAAIQIMHKHPTAVAFTYILPDSEHKLKGTVFLKGKKPVSSSLRLLESLRCTLSFMRSLCRDAYYVYISKWLFCSSYQSRLSFNLFVRSPPILGVYRISSIFTGILAD